MHGRLSILILVSLSAGENLVASDNDEIRFRLDDYDSVSSDINDSISSIGSTGEIGHGILPVEIYVKIIEYLIAVDEWTPIRSVSQKFLAITIYLRQKTSIEEQGKSLRSLAKRVTRISIPSVVRMLKILHRLESVPNSILAMESLGYEMKEQERKTENKENVITILRKTLPFGLSPTFWLFDGPRRVKRLAKLYDIDDDEFEVVPILKKIKFAIINDPISYYAIWGAAIAFSVYPFYQFTTEQMEAMRKALADAYAHGQVDPEQYGVLARCPKGECGEICSDKTIEMRCPCTYGCNIPIDFGEVEKVNPNYLSLFPPECRFPELGDVPPFNQIIVGNKDNLTVAIPSIESKRCGQTEGDCIDPNRFNVYFKYSMTIIKDLNGTRLAELNNGPDVCRVMLMGVYSLICVCLFFIPFMC